MGLTAPVAQPVSILRATFWKVVIKRKIVMLFKIWTLFLINCRKLYCILKVWKTTVHSLLKNAARGLHLIKIWRHYVYSQFIEDISLSQIPYHIANTSKIPYYLKYLRKQSVHLAGIDGLSPCGSAWAHRICVTTLSTCGDSQYRLRLRMGTSNVTRYFQYLHKWSVYRLTNISKNCWRHRKVFFLVCWCLLEVVLCK